MVYLHIDFSYVRECIYYYDSILLCCIRFTNECAFMVGFIIITVHC